MTSEPTQRTRFRFCSAPCTTETNRIELVLCMSFSMGGLTLVTSAKAILGFVRFVRCYYLVVVTETKPEGIIMGHVIYSITVRNTIEFQIELRSHSAQNRALLQKQAQIPPLAQERGRRFPFRGDSRLGPRGSLSGSLQHGRSHQGILLLLQLPAPLLRPAEHSPVRPFSHFHGFYGFSSFYEPY